MELEMVYDKAILSYWGSSRQGMTIIANNG